MTFTDEAEDLASGATKATIDSLIYWVKDLQKNQLFDNQVEIRAYSRYPYDFYFCLDEVVFTGPYQDKTSQQTVTYKFAAKGNGLKCYKHYFESLWENNCGNI